jgi:hypothetical protein
LFAQAGDRITGGLAAVSAALLIRLVQRFPDMVERLAQI